MSFYGNSFYYTAESFARVVLQNSGLNKYITTLPDEDPFKEVSSDKPVELDALQRNSGLGVRSGNHWIKLASSGNTFQILHNEPGGDKNTTKTIQSAVRDAKEGNGAVLLNFGKQLEMPVIKYDATGHIFNDGNVTYVQMPNDPTEDVKKDIEDIEKEQESIKEEQKKFTTTFTQWQNTTIPNITTIANDASAQATTAYNKAVAAETAATTATNHVNNQAANITSILDRLDILEAWMETSKSEA